MKIPARLGLIAFGFAASLALACAADAPAPDGGPAAATPPLSEEAVSLQGFALQNPLCREWSDACAVCARDEKDAAHCSTPGIACQPGPIVCRRPPSK